MTEGPKFTSRETFQITGRGTVYVCDLPDELWNAPHAPKLSGKQVWIDGYLHTIRGVEMPCIQWRPGAKAFKTVGLLVSPQSPQQDLPLPVPQTGLKGAQISHPDRAMTLQGVHGA